MHSWTRWFRCALGGAMVLVASTAQAATVTADFSESLGKSSTVVDAYLGKAGSGWAGGWVEKVDSSNTISGTVLASSSSPLGDGGNYLSLTGGGSAGTKAVTRQLDSAVLNTAFPYTVQWKYRLDSATTGFTTFNDRVHFGASGTETGPSGTNNSWLIGAVGADSGMTNLVPDGNFYFFNYKANNSSTFSGTNLVDTGIALTQDVVYSFTVNVNPATRTYSARIDAEGGSFFEQSNLGFRSNSPAANQYLVFGGVTSTTNEAINYSLDGISVTGIPEPTNAGLLVIACGGFLLSRKRRQLA